MPHIRVLGFRAHSNGPALVIDTDSNWIDLTIQTGSVLAIQLLGGSSYPVYIFNFRHGKPTLVAKDRSAGGITYAEEHLDNPIRDVVVITVPPKVYPDESGAFPQGAPHRYRLNETE